MVCETQTRLPERAARQAPVVVEPQTEAEVEVAEGHLVLCEYRGLVDRATAAEVQKTAAPRKVEGQQTGQESVIRDVTRAGTPGWRCDCCTRHGGAGIRQADRIDSRGSDGKPCILGKAGLAVLHADLDAVALFRNLKIRLESRAPQLARLRNAARRVRERIGTRHVID